MALQILEALLDRGDILTLQIVLGHAAMHLERPDRRDDHGASRA